jgi:quinol-cytochrome oxidoreductase complex cytochrome b subunit
MRPSFFHHLHPPSIPIKQARFRYTLAAGGLSAFLVLLLFMTGMLEVFYYIPTPADAPVTIQTLAFLVPFGGLVRNLHFWAAQFLVIVAGTHLLRVVMTGAYSPPRRLNFLLGMGLFVSAVLLDFTGYILRWDEGIRWALVAGTNLLRSIPLAGEALYGIVVGGASPGPATLIRFYAWHIFGLMLVMSILLTWHIFRVRRDGGIAVPPPPLRETKVRLSRNSLVRREVAAMLLASIGLLLLSLFAPAPIASSMTSSSVLSSAARAPWFFLWVQQMLKWGSPFIWGVVVPLAVLLAVTLIPYIFPKTSPGELGKWFPRSGRTAQVFFFLIIISILILTLFSLFTS